MMDDDHDFQVNQYPIATRLARNSNLFKELLPFEIRLRIFANLGPIDLIRIMRVSKDFASLSMDGSLWRSLDASDFYTATSQSQLVNIAKAGGRFLRNVNLRGCSQLTCQSFRDIADSCPNLVHCNLQGCAMTPSTISHLIKQSPNLVTLNVANVQAVHNTSLMSLGIHCDKLESLNLSWCKTLTHIGLKHLVNGCQNLKHLNLSGCTGLTDAALPYIGRLAQLKQLNLSFCSLLQPMALRTFFETHRDIRLTHLSLDHCNLLTDDAFRPLPRPKIEYGWNNRSTSQMTPESGIMLTDLTHLSLAGCSNLTDASFTSILTLMSGKLRKIDLEEVMRITDATLGTITRNAPLLESATLSFCDLLSDEAVISLIQASKKLVHLEIDNTRIGESVVRAFGKTMKERRAATNQAKLQALTDDEGYDDVEEVNNEGEDNNSDVLATASNGLSGPAVLEVYDCRHISGDVVRQENASDENVVSVRSFWWWQERDRQQRRRNRRLGRSRRGRNNNDANGMSGDEGLGGNDEDGGTVRRGLNPFTRNRSSSGASNASTRTDGSTASRWRRAFGSRDRRTGRRREGCIVA